MKKISEKTLFEGNWLLLKETTYSNSGGNEIKWESIERKRKRVVLVVIGILVPSNRYVLIRQYRPAVDNYVIGFHAGISDSYNIAEEALRELREETGYVGRVTAISPILKVNSGIMDDSCNIINVEIDEKDPRNANPMQSLEPSEEIEVVLKREDNIKKFLQQEKKKGYEIGAGLWYFFGIK